MATKRWIAVGALAGALLLPSAAEASSRRDAATQIENNLSRLGRPIGREIGRLGRWTRLDRAAHYSRAFGRDRWFENGEDSDASSGSGARRSAEAFDWSRAIAAGKEIEIKGVNGDISASRAKAGEVGVKATKRWKRSDPDDVTIEVIEHEGGVTICAKYPASRGKQNVCGPGDEGNMNTRDNDVQVDFEVRVPAGVRLVARTVNGEVEAEGLASPVDAATVNGTVRVTTTGYASAQTVNGSIRVSLGSAAWPEPISFQTVNGTIDLTLPAKLDADVRAETMNGSIDTDFPITVSGRTSRRRLQGTIGKGGRRLDVETVNGNITLRLPS